MSLIDWVIMLITIFSVVGFGMWRSRGIRQINGYLLADRKLPWYHVGFSVMATQASAITFLSAPAQGYSDGLRFVQFYFGLPLAMILICMVFIPIYQGLQVFTAYEYLEKRFDIRTRVFTAILFLIQRGISTGITLFAPALVLSVILHVDIFLTTCFMGGLVILYTWYGGAKAVSHTQLLQMTVIFGGLALAAGMVIHLLPYGIGFTDALHVAGKMNRLDAIDTSFDWNNRYNIWSGIIGGFFLQLSYFGTDQSQVGRYLTGSSVAQSRLGLLMNGMLKVPMQFFILLIGVMVFVFYQFHTPPVFFNPVEVRKAGTGLYAAGFDSINQAWQEAHQEKAARVKNLVLAVHDHNPEQVDRYKKELYADQDKMTHIRQAAVDLIKKTSPDSDANDSNYVFLHFVTNWLPRGLVGLLLAIIFLAAMGSTASGLSALTSACVIDFYKRFFHPNGTEKHFLMASRLTTLAWGLFCILIAMYAGRLGNLIEAVNILGSLFYGTILGIFLTAFFIRRAGGRAVFAAALVTELVVVVLWWFEVTAFLWLNVAGALLVMLLAVFFQEVWYRKKKKA